MATRAAPASSRHPIPIVALDFPRADVALAMVDRLGDACKFYKVGGELTSFSISSSTTSPTP